MRDGGRRRAALVAALLVAAAGACTGGASKARPTASVTPVTEIRTGPAPPGWDRLADMPTARLEVAAALSSDGIVVAGGLVQRGVTDIVERHGPGGWTTLTPLPRRIHHAAAVAWRGTFIVLGGFQGGPQGVFDNASRRVWALGCPETFRCAPGVTWLELPPMRVARGAFAAGVAGDLLVVAGGQADGKLVRETEIFDFVTRRWRAGARMPTPRDHLASASDGTYLYAIGGRRISMGSVLDAAERYDPATNRWERLPPLPTARGGFCAAFVPAPVKGTEGAIVTAGGEDRAKTYAEVEVLGVKSLRWFADSPLRQARHGLGVVAVGNILYAIAGGPEVGRSVSKRVEAMTLSDVWL